MPLFAYLIGTFLALSPILLAIVVIFSAMPTAPSAFILARQLGGDTRLMASIITFQTLLSVLTLSFLLGILAL